MIAWLMTNWMTQLATIAFATWFARGVWKATMRPRLTYVSHQEVKSEKTTILTVKRNQLLPPWRTLEETWMLTGTSGYYDYAIRESDGLRVNTNSDLWGGIVRQLYGMRNARRIRDAETDELLKQEARPN